jgi:D-alanyl-D-alanine carboxypeptidase
MKTGYHASAGYCLIATALRAPRRLVSVVLGTESETARAQESQKLLNYGFQFYDTVRLYQKGQQVGAIPMYKGAKAELKAGFREDFILSVPRGMADRLKATLESMQPLVAPVAEGQRVEKVAGSVPAATGYSRASYAATVAAGPGEQRVRAEGTCTDAAGRSVRTVIAVRFVLRANTWELATWAEGSPADVPVAP